jgi:uncharacterized protein YuzE
MKSIGPDEEGFAYVYLTEPKSNELITMPVDAQIDIALDGTIVGIEILNCSQALKFPKDNHEQEK